MLQNLLLKRYKTHIKEETIVSIVILSHLQVCCASNILF